MDIQQTDIREPEDKKAFAEYIRDNIKPNVQKVLGMFNNWFLQNKQHLLTLFYPNTYTEQAFKDWCRKRFYYWMYNTHTNVARQIDELTK